MQKSYNFLQVLKQGHKRGRPFLIGDSHNFTLKNLKNFGNDKKDKKIQELEEFWGLFWKNR